MTEFSEIERMMNIDLCLEVEKLPCLYNSSLEDHSKRSTVEKAWADIGKKLGVSGEVCKKRWINLRTAYVRKRTKPPKRKEYYLYKYMQFLIPHINIPTKPSRNNLLASSCDNYSQKDQPYISEQEQTSESQISNNDEYENNSQDDSVYIKEEPQIDDTNTYHNQTMSDQVSHQSIENITTEESNIDESFIDYLQSKKRKLSVDPEDPRRCFLLSLLPEVHELPETQFRLFKRRVLALIDEFFTT